jgi:hypothetical protein
MSPAGRAQMALRGLRARLLAAAGRGTLRTP